MEFVFFVVGLVALVIGAELLVRGASALALSFGVTPLVVGLTVVAMGTSAPEVAVSVDAAFAGVSDIAIGNVIGSNVFNVLFILGASALVVPLAVHRQVIWQEVPLMIGASLLLALMLEDGRLGTGEGSVLLLLLAAYVGMQVVQARGAAPDPSEEAAPSASLPMQLTQIVGGLGLLVLGAGWLVDASVAFARYLGVSDAVVGLTIVAAGTSLPEVATSLTAAARGERDIAVGNVVGSNIFNILGCLGASALAAGGEGLQVASTVLEVDLWVMVAIAVALMPICMTGREISRWEGAVLLFYYVAYTSWLVLGAQGSPLVGPLGLALAGLLAPLTALVLGVLALRELRQADAAA